MATAGLTWLHLSDWHQKGMDFDRKVVRDALVDDIKKDQGTGEFFFPESQKIFPGH